LTGQRHAVLVLGVARSGTSALSGALAAAGVDFGPDLKPADWQNPRGSFEDFTLSRLNQAMLAAVNRNWSSLRPMPRDWRSNANVRELEAAVRDKLVERLDTSPLFGLKDPRLVPLFDVYDDALRAIGAKLWAVAIQRDRREVVRSIRRSGYYHGRFPALGGRRLVRLYELQIAAIADRTEVGKTEFRDLIDRPETTLSKVLTALPFKECGLVPDIGKAVASIDPSLTRNRS